MSNLQYSCGKVVFPLYLFPVKITKRQEKNMWKIKHIFDGRSAARAVSEGFCDFDPGGWNRAVCIGGGCVADRAGAGRGRYLAGSIIREVLKVKNGSVCF